LKYECRYTTNPKSPIPKCCDAPASHFALVKDDKGKRVAIPVCTRHAERWQKTQDAELIEIPDQFLDEEEKRK
jgi:uncharacterized protein YdaT